VVGCGHRQTTVWNARRERSFVCVATGFAATQTVLGYFAHDSSRRPLAVAALLRRTAIHRQLAHALAHLSK
jgi:hypothetical protein